MKPARLFAIVLLAAGAVAFVSPSAEAQCAMCKTSLTQSPEGRSIAKEFNKAILVMLAAPYLVAATLGAVAFRKPLRHEAFRLGTIWAVRARALTGGRTLTRPHLVTR